jgi:imidazolonepropionase-like amidohydrolase
MVKWGATPLQAIESATVTAAAALGQSADVGQIKRGACGDLVGVRRNPRKDIALLERPIFVMKGGEAVRLRQVETRWTQAVCLGLRPISLGASLGTDRREALA